MGMTPEFNRLFRAPGNAVIYSDKAWAAARKSSDGRDVWFVDPGAWSKNGGQADSAQLVSWVDDWRILR